MKKIILILICLLLVTGCKVNYNLSIKKDLSVSENVHMTGTDEFFALYYKSSRLNIINMVLKGLDGENEKKLKEYGYDYKIIGKDNPYLLANKTYSNINGLCSNSIFYKQYFKKLNCSTKDGVITIKGEKFLSNSSENSERFDIANTTINIKSDYVIKNSNADKINRNKNIYTWHINRDIKDFEFFISIDTTKSFADTNNYAFLFFALKITILILLLLSILYYNNKKKQK